MFKIYSFTSDENVKFWLDQSCIDHQIYVDFCKVECKVGECDSLSRVFAQYSAIHFEKLFYFSLNFISQSSITYIII